jgi:hypothetical protein
VGSGVVVGAPRDPGSYLVPKRHAARTSWAALRVGRSIERGQSRKEGGDGAEWGDAQQSEWTRGFPLLLVVGVPRDPRSYLVTKIHAAWTSRGLRCASVSPSRGVKVGGRAGWG